MGSLKANKWILLCIMASWTSCLREKPVYEPYGGFEPVDLNDGWIISTPEAEDVDRETLSRAFEMIYREDDYPLATALLVARHNRLIGEAYPRGEDYIQRYHNIQSCTKSIASLLLGAAVDQQIISSLNERLYDIFPELFDDDEVKREMTIAHALTMQTGINFENDRHTLELYSTEMNSTAFVLSLDRLYRPGTGVQYQDGAPHLISKVIEEKSGQTLSQFAQSVFLSKMGIYNWQWEAAKDGTDFGAFSLYLTARDLAKIGRLILQRGQWQGEQLVDSSYLREALSHQVNIDLNDQPYGYYFWLYPEWNAYAALGHGGQFLFVAPDKDLVVVYLAWPYTAPELWGDSKQLMQRVLDSCH